MRVWVERVPGMPVRGGVRFDGSGHEYVDCTDLPMPTVVAGRPVNVVLVWEDGDEAPAPG